MKFLKRGILICFAGAVLLIAAILIYWSTGSTSIESWIGSQLLSMCGGYLNPELHFKKITYVRPRTVLLDELSLTSPDPENAGQSVTILAVKQAQIELTEIPRRGQPIRFSQITLDSPEFRAIAVKPGGGGAGGGFAGYSNFIKGSGTPAAAGSTPPPASQPATAAAPMKLSDVLLIRKIQIKNGLVRYDPRLENAKAMQLDNINTTLDFAPVAADAANGGRYSLQTTIARDPVFKLELEGKMDIDTITFDLSKLTLNLNLSEENAHFLPPEIQQVLHEFEITGLLQASAAGTIPMADFKQSRLQSTLTLSKAQAAGGKYRIGIDSFTSTANLADGAMVLQNADATLLGGTLHAAGNVPLDPAAPAQLTLEANGLQIEQTLRTADPNVPPAYSGTLAANISYNAPLSQWKSRSSGGGTINVRNGRIINLPVLGSILTEVDTLLSATIKQITPAEHDSADARFAFAGNHIELQSFTGQLGVLNLRANGTIGFDQRIDIHMNVTPLGKDVRNSLGAVGKLLGQATDAVLSYRVTGLLSSPKVSLDVGGRK